MKPDCRRFEERIAGYVDRSLPTEEATAFESHWNSCPDCGALFSDLFEADSGDDVPLEVERSAELWRGIETALSAPKVAQTPAATRATVRARRSKLPWILAAAGLAAALPVI